MAVRPSTVSLYRHKPQPLGRLLHRPLWLLLLLCLSWPLAAQTGKPTDDPRLRQMLRDAISESSSFQDRFDAEVWLVDMSARLSRYVLDEEERLTILRLVHREATQHGLDPELVLAVIHVESLFERFAVSSAGAMGIMQIMPFWKNEIGRGDDNLMQLETNVRYGTTILRYYIDKENGDLIRALARYNGSLGQTWYPERVFNALERFYRVNY
ncbi:MAG: lytic transglycosylase domain-containing protein [Halomonadaceae bacterium]|nr:MAG: lytic transglycosylase domain-containing protein [Halomonadaceae bacterium]